MAVRRGYIDYAATWRMLLKLRRFIFSHFRWPHVFDFQHEVSYECSVVTIDLKYTSLLTKIGSTST